MRSSLMCLALAAVLAAPTSAQHSSYVDQKSNAIKALSAEEIQQYLDGAGMGYARAAELNRFPGPMHVLELADALSLTAEQRSAVRKLMDAHKSDARAIGSRLVEAERTLDQLFASGTVDENTLSKHALTAAALQGEYRLSHLETHRRLRAVLTTEQVQRYEHLRGYSPQSGHRGNHGH